MSLDWEPSGSKLWKFILSEVCTLRQLIKHPVLMGNCTLFICNETAEKLKIRRIFQSSYSLIGTRMNVCRKYFLDVCSNFEINEGQQKYLYYSPMILIIYTNSFNTVEKGHMFTLSYKLCPPFSIKPLQIHI